jgi:hypothetical protein
MGKLQALLVTSRRYEYLDDAASNDGKINDELWNVW